MLSHELFLLPVRMRSHEGRGEVYLAFPDPLPSAHRPMFAALPLPRGSPLLATSADGVLMYRLIARHPDRVQGALGTFPVYDLLDSFGPGVRRRLGSVLSRGAGGSDQREEPA